MTGVQTCALPICLAAGGQAPDARRELSVVCVGAHPDDPESGCGGTLAMYAARGHRVTVIYLTRGEAGIATIMPMTSGRIPLQCSPT